MTPTVQDVLYLAGHGCTKLPFCKARLQEAC
jgi:hypothetical protein